MIGHSNKPLKLSLKKREGSLQKKTKLKLE